MEIKVCLNHWELGGAHLEGVKFLHRDLEEKRFSNSSSQIPFNQQN